jgi:hypothetical protein
MRGIVWTCLDVLARAMRHATRDTGSVISLGFANALIVLIDLANKVSLSIIPAMR